MITRYAMRRTTGFWLSILVRLDNFRQARKSRRINNKKRKNNMKKLTTIIIAILTLSSPAWAVDLIVKNQRDPSQRITLSNNQVRVVTSVVIPTNGKWFVAGGATMQITVDPNVHGQYIYSVAAFSLSPNVLPEDGTAGLDARPYGTWWFDSSPKQNAIDVTNAPVTVYLLVRYSVNQGTPPAQLAQSFGNIVALRD